MGIQYTGILEEQMEVSGLAAKNRIIGLLRRRQKQTTTTTDSIGCVYLFRQRSVSTRRIEAQDKKREELYT
jgi:hypothetical protein